MWFGGEISPKIDVLTAQSCAQQNAEGMGFQGWDFRLTSDGLTTERSRGKWWNGRNVSLVGGGQSLSFSVSLSVCLSLSLCVALTLAFLPVHYKANIFSPPHPPPVIFLPQAQPDQPHMG